MFKQILFYWTCSVHENTPSCTEHKNNNYKSILFYVTAICDREREKTGKEVVGCGVEEGRVESKWGVEGKWQSFPSEASR